MKHAGDNEEKKITASKIEKDELYLYSLRKMADNNICLLYTSPSPRDRTRSRMPSSA